MLRFGAQKSRPWKISEAPSFSSPRVDDAGFDADIDGHGVDAGRVEGGRQADGLRVLGSAVDGDAVQRLAPPVIGRHLETRNGARLVDELRGLLLERHAMHQVLSADLGREVRIQVGRIGSVLRSCGWRGGGEDQKCGTGSEARHQGSGESLHHVSPEKECCEATAAIRAQSEDSAARRRRDDWAALLSQSIYRG